MQTFLPYPDYRWSAVVLDYRRLGKQRVECKQILMALTGQSKGWRNHPATRMWTGLEANLAEYAVAMCTEWRRRGYKDTLLEYFQQFIEAQHVAARMGVVGPNWLRPSWMGRPELHASHRSNLLRKDPVYYGQFGWRESPDLDYVWPV